MTTCLIFCWSPFYCQKKHGESWTMLDAWRCTVVSDNKMLAKILSSVSCEVGPPGLELLNQLCVWYSLFDLVCWSVQFWVVWRGFLLRLCFCSYLVFIVIIFRFSSRLFFLSSCVPFVKSAFLLDLLCLVSLVFMFIYLLSVSRSFVFIPVCVYASCFILYMSLHVLWSLGTVPPITVFPVCFAFPH